MTRGQMILMTVVVVLGVLATILPLDEHSPTLSAIVVVLALFALIAMWVKHLWPRQRRT